MSDRTTRLEERVAELLRSVDELSEVVADRSGRSPREVLDDWARQAPVRRLLEPDEIAASIAFLCSPEASGITGVALPVDGGFSHGLL